MTRERNMFKSAKLELPKCVSTTSVWSRQTEKLKISIEGLYPCRFHDYDTDGRYTMCYYHWEYLVKGVRWDSEMFLTTACEPTII